MDRLTGNDALGLMEAYSNVYAQQELTEEQVWEEVEYWVNGLVEEGYDLSDYTWEDMYEAYIEEGGPGPRATTPNPPGITMYGGANDPRRRNNQPYQSTFARPRQDTLRSLNTPSNSTRRPGTVSNLGSGYRGQELQTAAAARASQVGTTRQGTAGGPTVGGNTPIGTSTRTAPRPGATTPAPAPTPAPRPGATPPAPAPRAGAGAPPPTGKPTPRPAVPSYAGATGLRPVGTPLPTNAVQPVAGEIGRAHV